RRRSRRGVPLRRRPPSRSCLGRPRLPAVLLAWLLGLGIVGALQVAPWFLPGGDSRRRSRPLPVDARPARGGSPGGEVGGGGGEARRAQEAEHRSEEAACDPD